jgi:hypothetical protein
MGTTGQEIVTESSRNEIKNSSQAKEHVYDKPGFVAAKWQATTYSYRNVERIYLLVINLFLARFGLHRYVPRSTLLLPLIITWQEVAK